MRKSERHELILFADNALKQAFVKYEEVLAELNEDENFRDTNLTVTIHDSIKNLRRKTESYFKGQIDQNKVIDEFIFEQETLEEELSNSKDEPARVKRLAKRLLSSYEDFIQKSGGLKKKKFRRREDPLSYHAKTKGKAYFFWLISFFGVMGFHRFYLGRTGSGFGWLFTGGLFGFGALYDLFTLPKMVEEQNLYNELRYTKLKQLTSGKGN